MNYFYLNNIKVRILFWIFKVLLWEINFKFKWDDIKSVNKDWGLGNG